MKITIITPSAFGYIDLMVDELGKKNGVKVNYINFSEFRYRYTSKIDKLRNGLKKFFLGQNIKDVYRTTKIIQSIESEGKQDFIVIIRPDKLETRLLVSLKSYTDNFYAFYFDAISKFPSKKKLIPYFDRVYSYEKADVEQYNLNFITNYIYDRDLEREEPFAYKIFNISSYDERFPNLEKIASYLKNQKIKYRIIVRKERPIINDVVEIVSEYKSLAEVKKLITRSEILLDIQKENQSGLSFRVFEALGYEKKLITTNEDVITYNFYNPNNILVIQPDNLHIPDSFLNTPYEKVPESILNTYTIGHWVQKVFEVNQ